MHCLHHEKLAVQNKVKVNGDLLNEIGFESAQKICKKKFGLGVVLKCKCRD